MKQTIFIPILLFTSNISKELSQTESLWLGAVLAKVAPDKYKLEIRK